MAQFMASMRGPELLYRSLISTYLHYVLFDFLDLDRLDLGETVSGSVDGTRVAILWILDWSSAWCLSGGPGKLLGRHHGTREYNEIYLLIYLWKSPLLARAQWFHDIGAQQLSLCRHTEVWLIYFCNLYKALCRNR